MDYFGLESAFAQISSFLVDVSFKSGPVLIIFPYISSNLN
jgi:hypothetical protein